MADHPGATVYRNYVERFLKGDIDSIAALLADDVVWHEPGGADAIVGKQPLLGQMRWVTSVLNVEIDIHDVVASDQHVVGLVEWRVAAADRSLVSRQVEIWHVRHELVTERWLFVDDFQAMVDFFEAVAQSP